MHETYHTKWGKKMLVLHPGDYASSKEDLLLCTVLGSCIAVVIFDPKAKIAGMNHFMLPTSRTITNIVMEESGKYGMFAMELLINDVLKKGGHRGDLVAKVFGGGHVLNTHSGTSMLQNVPQTNIAFAKEYLKIEKIPIVASDLGGVTGRKIYLYTQTGRVLLKRISREASMEVVQEESDYQRLLNKKNTSTGPVFF